MDSKQTSRTGLQGIVPRGRSAIISLIVVAIAAFALGGLLSGGGESSGPARGNDGHGHTVASEVSEPTLWTCSMHPQIQLPKPGKCPLCFMDLIPVESGSGGGELDPSQIRLSEAAVKLAKIQTTPVTRAYAERALRLVGRLDYDETTVANITAWVPGRLDKLFVDYTGATVTAGEPLVRMYSPELIAAREELLQSRQAIGALSETSSAVLKSTAGETARSAREKLRLYGLTEDQIMAIEQGDGSPEYLTIAAPASGVVVHKDGKEGMYVSTGTRIYTIADLSRLWVLLAAYESDLPWLKLGQAISFTSPSFPGETFEAVISFIDPTVDPSTRTVAVRAEVGNKDGRLKPEMFVSGTVRSRLDADGNVIAPEPAGKEPTGNAPVLIPATAPLVTGKRAVVYVMVSDDDGPVFEGRVITLGPRAGDYYVVKDGLEEGEQVVTNGAFKIDSELQLQAKPSMMSPTGGAAMAGHQHGQAEMSPDASTAMANEYKAGDASGTDAGKEARTALGPVYAAYFAVQMALAEDKPDAAIDAFATFGQAVSEVDMRLFTGEAHTRWMKISHALADAATTGQAAESLERARDAFYHVSLAAIELHDTFGHADGDAYYLTYCPMARNNTGAYWLQQADMVWNSFYGAAMLRCGEIKQKLDAGDTVTE